MRLLVEFRTGKSPILLATDVASRGLGKSAMWALASTVTGYLVANVCEMFCIMMTCPSNSAGMSHSFCGGHAKTLQWLVGGVNPTCHSLGLKPYITG